ncbi:MAG TPA: hypothetical protein VGB18_09040 [Candidatus Thermoplasmatota archaeon]
MAQAKRLPGIDARTVQKVCRRFASDERLLESSTVVRRTGESGSGERQYELDVGEWIVVLVLDAGDLVITDIRNR